jgi:hypothetical protein
MELPEDFVPDYNQILKLSKPKGFSVLEFSRHPDMDLDNIIEFWRYDKRKSSKGESSWLTESDFKSHLPKYLESFPLVEIETKNQKTNKK